MFLFSPSLFFYLKTHPDENKTMMTRKDSPLLFLFFLSCETEARNRSSPFEDRALS